eukprot:363976-Chlamydomonas_euryale.AAC.3
MQLEGTPPHAAGRHTPCSLMAHPMRLEGTPHAAEWHPPCSWKAHPMQLKGTPHAAERHIPCSWKAHPVQLEGTPHAAGRHTPCSSWGASMHSTSALRAFTAGKHASLACMHGAHALQP